MSLGTADHWYGRHTLFLLHRYCQWHSGWVSKCFLWAGEEAWRATDPLCNFWRKACFHFTQPKMKIKPVWAFCKGNFYQHNGFPWKSEDWFYACPSLSFCQSETNCVYRSRVQAVVAALSCTVSNQYLTSARGAFFPCSFLMKSRTLYGRWCLPSSLPGQRAAPALVGRSWWALAGLQSHSC